VAYFPNGTAGTMYQERYCHIIGKPPAPNGGEAWAISTFLHGMPARVPVDILAERGVKVRAS